MNKEKFRKYQSIIGDIERVNEMLRRIEKGYGALPMLPVIFKKRWAFGEYIHMSDMEAVNKKERPDKIYIIPYDLQKRIISVMREYLEDKEKELEDI